MATRHSRRQRARGLVGICARVVHEDRSKQIRSRLYPLLTDRRNQSEANVRRHMRVFAYEISGRRIRQNRERLGLNCKISAPLLITSDRLRNGADSTLLLQRDLLFLQESGECLHLIHCYIRDGTVGYAVLCPKEDVVSLASLPSRFFGVFLWGRQTNRLIGCNLR